MGDKALRGADDERKRLIEEKKRKAMKSQNDLTNDADKFEVRKLIFTYDFLLSVNSVVWSLLEVIMYWQMISLRHAFTSL
jgi:hypothetical protein